MLFGVQPLRFAFIARESVHFPAGQSANIIRGAFGSIFRGLACSPQCDDSRTCELRAKCAYARLFEPSALTLAEKSVPRTEDVEAHTEPRQWAKSPSGLADWPRPFVFRAMHLDGLTIPPRSHFHFDLNLFDAQSAYAEYLVHAFAQLAGEGLGPRRAKVDLLTVEQLGQHGKPSDLIYDSRSPDRIYAVPPVQLDLGHADPAIHRVHVQFLTPTELKGGQQLAAKPDFGVLAARIRDRISALRQLYGPGPLDIDFRSFGQRAREVRTTRVELHHVDVIRRSTRTGQVHSIGGFIGEAEYEGDLSEFVPYLRAARWTGVGRQTVWGKGEIATLISDQPSQ